MIQEQPYEDSPHIVKVICPRCGKQKVTYSNKTRADYINAQRTKQDIETNRSAVRCLGCSDSMRTVKYKLLRALVRVEELVKLWREKKNKLLRLAREDYHTERQAKMFGQEVTKYRSQK